MSKAKQLELIADPANPNRMDDADKARMAKSMAEFGDLSGIILNRRTGYLIGGHQRTDVLKGCEIVTEDLPKPEPDGTVARGHIDYNGRKMALRVVDWPESKARAALLAANRFGRVGHDDAAILKDLLSELDTGEFDMDLTGYSHDVIEQMMTAAADVPVDSDEDIVGDSDPRIVVRLSFNPAVWLGARAEILEVARKLEDKYECTVKVEE